PRPYIQAAEKPCDDCTPSSGTWSWSESRVDFTLSAPTCASHVIGRPFPELPYNCGGGGTNATFQVIPVFKVARRGAAADTIAESKTLAMPRRHVEAKAATVPQTWTTITVKGIFKDGDEKRQNLVTLSSGPTGMMSANDPVFWNAKIAAGSLVLETK